MGLFKKKPETENQIVERLCSQAGHMIDMFKNVFTSPAGFDCEKAVILTSSLAGFACHQAVKANRESVQLVETADGRKFYFGDSVNRYLLESEFNTVGSVAVVTNISIDDIRDIVRKCAAAVGDNSYTLAGLNPQLIYNEAKECWNGIFNNMTSKYCKSPSEWPILFGIVAQSIAQIAINEGAPMEMTGTLSAEIMIYISKLDDDSFLS